MLEIIQSLSSDAFLVYVVLNERSQAVEKLKLDADYISRTANIGVDNVKRALDELITNDLLKFDGEKFHINDCVLTLVPMKREDKTIATLEREIAELQKQLADVQGHQLSLILKGEERILVQEMESDMARPLIAGEIFFLGILLGQFDVKRAKLAYRQVKDQRFPVRGMFAVLNNKAYGKGRDKKAESSTKYGTVGNVRDL